MTENNAQNKFNIWLVDGVDFMGIFNLEENFNSLKRARKILLDVVFIPSRNFNPFLSHVSECLRRHKFTVNLSHKKASKIKAWSPWILFSILSILPMPIPKLRENHENEELRNILNLRFVKSC